MYYYIIYKNKNLIESIINIKKIYIYIYIKYIRIKDINTELCKQYI